jgi:hypothetical protein
LIKSLISNDDDDDDDDDDDGRDRFIDDVFVLVVMELIIGLAVRFVWLLVSLDGDDSKT